MRHPGTITIIDETEMKTRVVAAEKLRAQARFARSSSGTKYPVLTIIRMKNGMVGIYGPNRKLLKVVKGEI